MLTGTSCLREVNHQSSPVGHHAERLACAAFSLPLCHGPPLLHFLSIGLASVPFAWDLAVVVAWGTLLAGLSVRCPQVPATARLKGISPAGPTLRMHCPDCIRQRLTPRVHRPDCAWRRLAWFPHASVLPCAPRESRCLSKQWSVWRGRGQHLPNDIAATRNTPARLASAWATLRMRRMAAVAKR